MKSSWMPMLPASAIDASIVEEFLQAAHAESNTHEYKLVGDTRRLPEVVSALANTHGGVVVVGVPDAWTGDFSTLRDVDHEAEARIVDTLVNSLDPSSWLPAFIPVDVDGHRLLVLKVDLIEAPRPLLAGGRGYLKREKRKVPASWFDLRALFNSERPRTPSVPSLSARFLNNPGDVSHLYQTSASPPDVVWRIAGGCSAWPDELSGCYADAGLRDRLAERLASTALEVWLRRFGAEHALKVADWVEVPPSRVGTASVALAAVRPQGNRAGPLASIHVQMDVAAEPSGPSGGGIAATVNLMFWHTALAEERSIAETGAIQQGRLEQYRPQLDVSGIGAVLDALIATCHDVIAAAQDALLSQRSFPFVGPAVWVAGDLDATWDLSSASDRRPATNSLGNHRGFDPPETFPETDDDRGRLVDKWLTSLLLTAGFVPQGRLWNG